MNDIQYLGDFICFLSMNDIQYLVLHLPSRERHLCSSLFICSQLNHLNLHCYSMNYPSTFQGFDKLISLKLLEIAISFDFLKWLTSHCPLLELLVLSIWERLDIVGISTPILRLYNFMREHISSIYLKNDPSGERNSARWNYAGRGSWFYKGFRVLFFS